MAKLKELEDNIRLYFNKDPDRKPMRLAWFNANGDPRQCCGMTAASRVAGGPYCGSTPIVYYCEVRYRMLRHEIQSFMSGWDGGGPDEDSDFFRLGQRLWNELSGKS